MPRFTDARLKVSQIGGRLRANQLDQRHFARPRERAAQAFPRHAENFGYGIALQAVRLAVVCEFVRRHPIERIDPYLPPAFRDLGAAIPGPTVAFVMADARSQKY